MDIVSRLKKYLDSTGLSSTQFADAAGIPRPTLSQILNGRNKKISNELITKLHEGFPSLNIMWLMFGDGEMSTGESASPLPFTISNPIAPGKSIADNNEGLFGFDNTISPSGYEEKFVQATVDDLKRNGIDKPIIENQQIKSGMTSSTTVKTLAKSDSKKKVASIMVFYTDNSYEIFRPAKE